MSEDNLFLDRLSFSGYTNFSELPNILRFLKNNQSKIEALFEDSQKAFLFFNNFCFDKMVNITFLDTTLIKLSADLLDCFANYNEFYEVSDAFNDTMEFILLTLFQTKNASEEIAFLLKLLSKILSRYNHKFKNSVRYVIDQQRILEVILTIAQIENVDLNYFNYYGSILNHVLEIQFPDWLDQIIAELFKIMRKHDALPAMAVICEQIFKKCKFGGEALNIVFVWLMEEASNFLNYKNSNSIPRVIHCWAELASISAFSKFADYAWANSYSVLTQNFIYCVNKICAFSSTLHIRASCMQILEYTITIYFGCNIESFLTFKKQQSIKEELLTLPENVEDWPRCNNKMFILICHIGILEDSFLWSKMDVLNSLMECFYAKQYVQKLYLFKTILYLYSYLIDGENITENLKIFGSDLIYTLEEFSLVSFVCTKTPSELKWLFASESLKIKMDLFIELLNDDYDESQLITIVQTNNIQKVLVSIILSPKYEAFGFRCALLLSKTQEKNVAQSIVNFLLLTVEETETFLNLLVTNPAVPSTEEKAVLICTVLGALLPSITNNLILKYACFYSTKVLATLNNSPNILIGFCENTSNLKHLIKIAGKVEDDVFDAIVNLLKVVISLQRKHSIKFESPVEANFSSFLNVSPDKNQESLKFLKIIMSYKTSLIKIDFESAFDIFLAILHFASIPNRNSTLFNECLKLFLQKNPSLCFSVSTSFYIKTMITKSLTKEETAFFLDVLCIWLSSLDADNGSGIVEVSVRNISMFVKKSCTDFRMTSHLESLLNKLGRKMWLLQCQQYSSSKNYFSFTHEHFQY